MNTLVIIPAFNEEVCLASTIRMLTDALPSINYIVIDDGSSDATFDICQKNNFPCISLPINTGLTSAFQAGMKYADRMGFDSAVQFDADGQHLPQYIPLMQEAMEKEQADIVIASRYLTGQKPVGARGTGSRLISLLIKLTSKTTIKDPTSGMRMFSRPMIEAYSKGFDITPEPDTLALFARKGAKIVEIPAKMQERQGGESYFDLPHIISYMSRTCFSLVLFQWFR